MYKRGQVTIFLVVGIVILALFAGIMYFTSYVRQNQLDDDATLHPLAARVRPQITSFVESCIEETAVPGIYLLGIQGGIIYPDDPTKILVTENALINYGYLNGVNQLSVEKMEQQLDKFIEENLAFCLDNFISFSEQAIVVMEQGGLQSKTKITSNDVLLELTYPLKVTLGKDQLEIETFQERIPLGVRKIVDEAEKIITFHQQNPGSIDTSALTSLNSFVSIFPFDEVTTIYSLSAEPALIDEASFTFMFAIRDYTRNSPPRLHFIPHAAIRKDQRLYLEFAADDDENDQVQYSSSSVEFPVSVDGIMDVTPTQPGTYSVTITIEDEGGLVDSQQFEIAVPP